MENEKLGKYANLAQIASFVLQVASIVLSLIAGAALALQKDPPKIPWTEIKLGEGFQILLMFCSLIVYFQFLRHFYVKNKRTKKLNKLYWDFLRQDVPIRFPILIVPILIIIGIIGVINGTIVIIFLFLAIPAVIASIE